MPLLLSDNQEAILEELENEVKKDIAISYSCILCQFILL